MAKPLIDMKTLFQAGVHFGHLTRFKEPQMSEFIYGVHNKINIINLEKTLPLLREALEFVEKISERNGKILFVGTKRSAKKIVAEYAAACNMPFVNHRWLGGMLTNYKTIKQSIRRMQNLAKAMVDSSAATLTKREILNMERQYTKLFASLGGIQDMGGLPDAIFIIDAGFEQIAIQEANRLKIPVIAVVDTNSKPTGVDYLIPGNDDAMGAITLYAKAVSDTINSTKDRRQQHAIPANKFQDDFVEVTENPEDND